MDKYTEAAAINILQHDEAFKTALRKAAVRGLQKLLYLMDNGTPDAQLRAATQFAKVYERVLAANQGEDDSAEKLKEAAQKMMSSMLVVEREDDDGIDAA